MKNFSISILDQYWITKDQDSVFSSGYDKEEWDGFWQEFDKLLEKHRKELRK